MLTAETALALFLMLAISSVSLLIAQRLRVPHTVMLVLIGVILAILASHPHLGWLGDFSLTPELLFFIFLPTLLFESAYNINIKNLSKDATIIGILAVFGLIASTVLIAFGLDYALPLVGVDVPFIVLLIFGAIISSTDPVAVLALFKEYGAPRRLSLIFEGESLFNDGTAVALFIVLLSVAESGLFGATEFIQGTISFIIMVIGGALFGLIFGGVFAKLIGWTRSNEFAAITLTMVLAHMTFICAEMFAHHVSIGGNPVYLSPIIATTVASLLMGNYGRYKMPAHASEFVEKYWSQFAFLANSLIFIMIGMLTIRLPESMPALLLPIGITILVVATARALSIYPTVRAFNAFTTETSRIPTAWQHVLAWGSLRGALAVTMALMIPDTLSFPNWSLAYTPKEFILALTVGCVFATLFVKATTIGSLMRTLKLNTFTAIEEINYREMLIYIYSATLKRLNESNKKGYIDNATYTTLREEQHERIRAAFDDLKRLSDPNILEKVIRLYAIGIERKYIKELFASNEVSERVIRNVMDKLEYQSYAIEHDDYGTDTYDHGFTRDIFETLANVVRRVFYRKETELDAMRESYLYYRALSIISRKVVKELGRLNACFEEAFNAPHHAVEKVTDVYESYRRGSTAKMAAMHARYPEIFTDLDATLARCAVQKNESYILHNLREREMVTQKVSIALNEHFVSENSTDTPHT